MKYVGMPAGMWLLFMGSFEKQTVSVLGFDRETARRIRKEAKEEHRKIIQHLPTFENGDRFQMNIVSCAMLAAFYLHMKPRPSVGQMTDFYREAMMTKPMQWFCRKSGKRKFTEKDIRSMQKTEAFRAADRNPYSWNMTYHPYADGSGYEARFTHCGICTLMKELNCFEIVPAMCALDYAMSEAGGASVFVREYTLAGGGPYCDCGYKRKENAK